MMLNSLSEWNATTNNLPDRISCETNFVDFKWGTSFSFLEALYSICEFGLWSLAKIFLFWMGNGFYEKSWKQLQILST